MLPDGRIRRQFQQSIPDYSAEDESVNLRKRKCSNPSLYPGLYADGHNTTVPGQKTRQLMIGDESEIERFYSVRFRDMQQSSCKLIAKAFVKLIEPKKRTHYPYTKGDIKAPPWWPDTKGNKSVRHKEPDHLLRPGKLHRGVLSSFSSQTWQ
jgi:hypothetical protein